MPFKIFKPRNRLLLLAGGAGALLLSHLVAGLFVTPERWVYPPLTILRDGKNNPFRVYRQITEGISSASINDSGARFTTEFLPGAPVVVMLGDSHVLGRNVNDGQVMGAVTANLARQSGYRLNIRELGRSGGTAADYALAAPDVLARWQPERVFIILSAHGLEIPPLRSSGAVIEQDAAGTLTVRAIPLRDSTSKRIYWRFRNSSPLAELFCNNPVNLWRMLRNSPQPDAETAGTPPHPADMEAPLRLAISALQQAYGPKLVIVYHPVVGVSGGGQPDRNELLLLRLCREGSIPAFSVRQAMVADREAHSRVGNGFINRLPGTGHLNANGHRIVGTAVWKFIERDRAR